ncbi:MAG TPA: SCO family protein [Ignavibacteriaceae bacterium]|nr:SCO family protein [Ignavibacteriaceae bacterium]
MNSFKVLSRIFISVLFFFFITARLSFADYKTAEVIQHLGTKIPNDLKFTDAEGKIVSLKELIDKPTVLDFCYYRCAGICTPLMVELTDIIGKVKYEPGKDYNIISISIDENETSKMAFQKKRAMFSLCSRQIPDSGWIFLTGDSTNIYRLTDITGFHFQRSKYGGFTHEGVLIFVDKDGKIVQYLNPGNTKAGDFQILPSSFELAVKSASKGEVTSAIESVLKTCYSFIPKGNDLIVLLAVLASGILTIGVVIIIIKKAKLTDSNYKA